VGCSGDWRVFSVACPRVLSHVPSPHHHLMVLWFEGRWCVSRTISGCCCSERSCRCSERFCSGLRRELWESSKNNMQLCCCSEGSCCLSDCGGDIWSSCLLKRFRYGLDTCPECQLWAGRFIGLWASWRHAWPPVQECTYERAVAVSTSSLSLEKNNTSLIVTFRHFCRVLSTDRARAPPP